MARGWGEREGRGGESESTSGWCSCRGTASSSRCRHRRRCRHCSTPTIPICLSAHCDTIVNSKISCLESRRHSTAPGVTHGSLRLEKYQWKIAGTNPRICALVCVLIMPVDWGALDIPSAILHPLTIQPSQPVVWWSNQVLCPPSSPSESLCLRSKKHAANEHNYFHPYRPRKQGPPRNDGTESSPDGVPWNARRVGALVLPSAVELAKLALGYGLLGCCGCVRTPARPLN
jgi:hypothetical protein